MRHAPHIKVLHWGTYVHEVCTSQRWGIRTRCMKHAPHSQFKCMLFKHFKTKFIIKNNLMLKTVQQCHHPPPWTTSAAATCIRPPDARPFAAAARFHPSENRVAVRRLRTASTYTSDREIMPPTPLPEKRCCQPMWTACPPEYCTRLPAWETTSAKPVHLWLRIACLPMLLCIPCSRAWDLVLLQINSLLGRSLSLSSFMH